MSRDTASEAPASRRARVRAAKACALYAFACALLAFPFWLHESFGDVSLAQVVFQFRHLGGASSLSQHVGIDFLVYCVIGPAVAAALLTWLVAALRRWSSARPHGSAAARRLVARAIAALQLTVLGIALGTFASRTDAVQLLTSAALAQYTDAADYFAAHYVPPGGVEIRPRARKNLVLVYVESLETTYTRHDLFERDLLAPLTAQQPVAFDAYRQMPGTGFTIAAVVSTQCGVPLYKLGLIDANTQGERVQAFLPNAVCLGDILAAQGYRNVFMGGASLDFSGKGKFLRSHHYDELYGREEWIRDGVPAARISGWGLHDDDLFERAKAKLRELHERGQPFNLTVLTVDTHRPSGYRSAGCAEGDKAAPGLDGIVECAAGQVADLIRYVRASGYAADTQVVVIGDHLSPPNELSDRLARVPDRHIYNGFFSADAPRPNRATLVHFDMLPTLLDFIGLQVVGGRMGLGHSGFGDVPGAAAIDAARAEQDARLQSPSPAYWALWEPVRGADGTAVGAAAASR